MINHENRRFWLRFIRDLLLYTTIMLLLMAVVSYFKGSASASGWPLPSRPVGFGAFIGFYSYKLKEHFGRKTGCLTFLCVICLISIAVFGLNEWFFSQFPIIPWSGFILILLGLLALAWLCHCYAKGASLAIRLGSDQGKYGKED